MEKNILTKDMLNEMGITVELGEDEQPRIYRTGIIHGFNKKIRTYELKQYELKSKRKFTEGKIYKYVAFSYNNKTVTIMISRLVYVYFKEDILDGNLDVDHIDNNPLNNNPKNLQLLTHKENIQKRGIGKNQYTAGMTQKEIEELRAISTNEVLKCKNLHAQLIADRNIVKKIKEELDLLRDTNGSKLEIIDKKYYLAIAKKNYEITHMKWKQAVKENSRYSKKSK